MLWWTFQNFVTSALMAGIVWLACRFGRIGPVGRHALWLVVLVKLLTPPLVAWPWALRDPVTWLMQPPAVSSLHIAPAAPIVAFPHIEYTTTVDKNPWPDDALPLVPQEAIEKPLVVAPPPPPPVVAVSPEPAVAPVPPPPVNWLAILIAWAGRVWLAGGVILALIHLVRIARMQRLCRRALPPDPALARRIADLSERLGLRPVRTRVVPGIHSPLIWCLFRPEMLWPMVMPEMAEASVRGLIVHEFAHLKRRDHWVGWLELVACCLWWWNPLFWYVRHQLRENAELACDAWVVETLPGGRRAYAEGLLSVCEVISGVSQRISRPATPIPALGVGTGGRRTLERRLAMILRDRIPLRLPRLGWFLIGLMLAGALPAWSEKTLDTTGSQEANLLRYGSTDMGGIEAAGEPLPADARELLGKYQQQKAAARAEMEQRQAAQRAQLIEQLHGLQERYTKAGQLDEAVAIRDRIRQLSGGTTANLQQFVDPPSAITFRGTMGQQIQVTVTGSKEGSVWGSDVYTDDSSIAAAAVHAGVLKPGERGPVFLTILPGQSSYNGVTRNDVTSMSYGLWPGSYRISAPLHSYTPLPARRSHVLPDPGNLVAYRDRVGMTFDFWLIGSKEGTVWGNGVYTDDSALAVAAVHAGVAAPGQVTAVRVTILPGQPSYGGSTQNGIVSYPYNAFPGSYRIEQNASTFQPGMGSSTSPIHRYGSNTTTTTAVEPPLDTLRADAAIKSDHPLVITRQVTGSTTGNVWGTDIYSDDSDIGTAAVHAGVLRDGEQGWVRLTLLSPQDSFTGSTRNGVTSRNWSAWRGSFRIERGSPVERRTLTTDELEFKPLPAPGETGPKVER